eukprot:Colp12_sorted_trinity150504_noHs@31483
MSDNRQKIATLKREFGNHLCDDVLEAVLGFNNGDVIAAGNFLRADAENPAFQQEQDAQGEYLPQNYRQRMQAITPVETQNSTVQSDADRTVSFFLSTTQTFLEHYEAQKNDRNTYFSVLLLLLARNIELGHGCRARVIAAAWARNDLEMANKLLALTKQFALPEVLKALSLLDSRRKVSEGEGGREKGREDSVSFHAITIV